MALFLYVEIGVLVILCLPFISARRQVTAVTGSVSNAAKMEQDVAFLRQISGESAGRLRLHVLPE